MRRSVLVTLVSVTFAAACSGDTEPSDPPIPTDALTTETASPTDTVTTTAAVTQTATSSNEPATESPSESTTESATPETDAMPTMPDEAKEDTEAGAEAFALHYIDLINATGVRPKPGVLEPLATDTCASCDNFEAAVRRLIESNQRYSSPPIQVDDAVAVTVGDGARATVMLEQLPTQVLEGENVIEETEGGERLTFVFSLALQDSRWLVEEIQLEVTS